MLVLSTNSSLCSFDPYPAFEALIPDLPTALDILTAN